MVICFLIRYEFFLKRLDDEILDKIFYEEFKKKNEVLEDLENSQKISKLTEIFFSEIKKNESVLKIREKFYKKINNDDPLEIMKNESLKNNYFSNLKNEISIFKNDDNFDNLTIQIFEDNFSNFFLISEFWDLYLNFILKKDKDYFNDFYFQQQNKIYLSNLE